MWAIFPLPMVSTKSHAQVAFHLPGTPLRFLHRSIFHLQLFFSEYATKTIGNN
jgi:hypothetical protein